MQSKGENAKSGIIFQICCMILFAGVAISMAVFILNFGASWPEWAPGPNPSLFAWIPLAMAGFVIFIFLRNIIKKLKSGETSDSSIMYASGVDTYSAEDVSTYEASGYTGATYIRTVPNFCNNCGSQIDEDSVEWKDSMTFTCPYCGEKQRAGRKAI